MDYVCYAYLILSMAKAHNNKNVTKEIITEEKQNAIMVKGSEDSQHCLSTAPLSNVAKDKAIKSPEWT